MAAAEVGTIGSAGATRSLPRPSSAHLLEYSAPTEGRTQHTANVIARHYSGWTSLLNGKANLHAANPAEIISGPQAVDLAKGDNFPDDLKSRILQYRLIRAANILALLIDSHFAVTKENSLTVAAIICDAVPLRGMAIHRFPNASIEDLTNLDPYGEDDDLAVNPCDRPCGGAWTASISSTDGEPKTNWQTEYKTIGAKKVSHQIGFTTECYDTTDSRRIASWGAISALNQFEPLIVRQWLQKRPLALFIPPEVVVDGIWLTKDRTLEQIIEICQSRCAGGHAFDDLPSMKEYGGFSQFANEMTTNLELPVVLDQFFVWEKGERLVTPKTTEAAWDKGIEAGEGYWMIPTLATITEADNPLWTNWQDGSIKDLLWGHGLSQFSLWSALAHEEVLTSETEDKLGVWSSVVYSQAFGYSAWGHYGQGVWAHASFLLPLQIDKGEIIRSDNKQRRMMLARVPIYAMAIKFASTLEEVWNGGGFSSCYSHGDQELQRFNPYMEINPCSPSISWRKRGLFTPNAIGELGATHAESAHMAAPGTPTKSGGFNPNVANHSLVRNSYATMTQSAGSSIAFVFGTTYPAHDGYLKLRRLPDGAAPHDLDQLVGRYRDQWKANPLGPHFPSGVKPIGSLLATVSNEDLRREWLRWSEHFFRNVILTIWPEYAPAQLDSDVPPVTIIARALLPTSRSGSAELMAAMILGWGPPTYYENKEAKRGSLNVVYYDLCYASKGKGRKTALMTADEVSEQLTSLRGVDAGPRKGAVAKIEFCSPYENDECCVVPLSRMAKLALSRAHERVSRVGRDVAMLDTYVFAVRGADFGLWDDKRKTWNPRSNSGEIAANLFEELELIRRAGGTVVLMISALTWLRDGVAHMAKSTIQFYQAALDRGFIVIPSDFMLWGDTHGGSYSSPQNKHRSCSALASLASAAIDIAWTTRNVFSSKDVANVLGLMYKYTAHPPSKDEMKGIEEHLKVKIWEGSSIYPGSTPSGSDDVEMKDAHPKAAAAGGSAPPSSPKAAQAPAQRPTQKSGQAAPAKPILKSPQGPPSKSAAAPPAKGAGCASSGTAPKAAQKPPHAPHGNPAAAPPAKGAGCISSGVAPKEGARPPPPKDAGKANLDVPKPAVPPIPTLAKSSSTPSDHSQAPKTPHMPHLKHRGGLVPLEGSSLQFQVTRLMSIRC